MPNAADRKSIREAEKRSARLERDRAEYLANAMSTIPGRAYIWTQLESAHVFASSYSPNPLQMAFTEGERNQGLLLLNDLMHYCPDQFIQAMREANGRRTESAARDDTVPATGEQPGSSDTDGRVEDESDPGAIIGPTGEVVYN